MTSSARYPTQASRRVLQFLDSSGQEPKKGIQQQKKERRGTTGPAGLCSGSRSTHRPLGYLVQPPEDSIHSAAQISLHVSFGPLGNPGFLYSESQSKFQSTRSTERLQGYERGTQSDDPPSFAFARAINASNKALNRGGSCAGRPCPNPLNTSYCDPGRWSWR